MRRIQAFLVPGAQALKGFGVFVVVLLSAQAHLNRYVLRVAGLNSLSVSPFYLPFQLQ
jgi:hypothetical protein